MRAEQIRSELGMQPKEMPRILGEGLASRRLKKRGHKRATTYYAPAALRRGATNHGRGAPPAGEMLPYNAERTPKASLRQGPAVALQEGRGILGGASVAMGHSHDHAMSPRPCQVTGHDHGGDVTDTTTTRAWPARHGDHD